LLSAWAWTRGTRPSSAHGISGRAASFDAPSWERANGPSGCGMGSETKEAPQGNGHKTEGQRKWHRRPRNCRAVPRAVYRPFLGKGCCPASPYFGIRLINASSCQNEEETVWRFQAFYQPIVLASGILTLGRSQQAGVLHPRTGSHSCLLSQPELQGNRIVLNATCNKASPSAAGP
jgi:hypothetical protein